MNETARQSAIQWIGFSASGAAMLLSLGAADDQRAILAYSVTVTVIIVAIAGLSLETSIAGVGIWSTNFIALLAALALVLSAAAGVTWSRHAPPDLLSPLVAAGAVVMSSQGLCNGILLRNGRSLMVFVGRSTGSATFLAAAVSLHFFGVGNGSYWYAGWISGQLMCLLFGASIIWRQRASVSVSSAVPATRLLRSSALLHIGVALNLVATRGDQVLLAEHGSTRDIADYGLSTPFVEASTAPAVSRSTRIVAREDQSWTGSHPMRMPATSAAISFVLGFGVVSGLAFVFLTLGRLSPRLAMTLLLTALAVSIQAAFKVVSARLLVSRGAALCAAANIVPAITMLTIGPTLVSEYGMAGAAAATLAAYLSGCAATLALTMRGEPKCLPHQS